MSELKDPKSIKYISREEYVKKLECEYRSESEAELIRKEIERLNEEEKIKKKKLFILFSIIRICCLVLLVLAIMGQLYSFYKLFRWIVSPAQCFCAFFAYKKDHDFFLSGFFFFAAWFNPILPIHLARGIWLLLDILNIVLIVSSFFVIKRNNRHHARNTFQK